MIRQCECEAVGQTRPAQHPAMTKDLLILILQAASETPPPLPPRSESPPILLQGSRNAGREHGDSHRYAPLTTDPDPNSKQKLGKSDKCVVFSSS